MKLTKKYYRRQPRVENMTECGTIICGKKQKVKYEESSARDKGAVFSDFFRKCSLENIQK